MAVKSATAATALAWVSVAYVRVFVRLYICTFVRLYVCACIRSFVFYLFIFLLHLCSLVSQLLGWSDLLVLEPIIRAVHE